MENTFTCAITPNPYRSQHQNPTLSLKNTTNRILRYQVASSHPHHFILMSPRIVILAPGISAQLKLKHSASAQCSDENHKLIVTDSHGSRHEVMLMCQNAPQLQSSKIELPKMIALDSSKVNQINIIEIPMNNTAAGNLKIIGKLITPKCTSNHRPNQEIIQNSQFQMRLFDCQFILLQGEKRMIRCQLKFFKQAQFEGKAVFQIVEEGTRTRWSEQVVIRGNSLARSQFVADNNSNRIDLINHQLLNGLQASGKLQLINNYHQPCRFKLQQIVELNDYPTYCQRIDEIFLKMSVREGELAANSMLPIDYCLSTRPTADDLSFIHRYWQILDETGANKLRNSPLLSKNIEITIKVQFGTDNLLNLRFRVHVINPALRLERIKQIKPNNFDIINDTQMDVPFKFLTNHACSFPKKLDHLKPGINSISVNWIKRSKQNFQDLPVSPIKIQISYSKLILYQEQGFKHGLSRPKTALIRPSSGLLKTNISSFDRQKICQRAPSRLGDAGVRQFKRVQAEDFSSELGRFMRGQQLLDSELKCLRVGQNKQGNVLTNSHCSKNIACFFLEKGWILLQKGCSYVFPFEKRSLRFEMGGRLYFLPASDSQTTAPYTVLKRDLLFCFNNNQKEFEVIGQVQVANNSEQTLMMYCTTLDEQYFHSMEPHNSLSIPPRSIGTFRIAFFPKSPVKPRQHKVVRVLQFLINGNSQKVTCIGEFINADVSLNLKQLFFKNCAYAQQVCQQVIISNKGLNKISFKIQHQGNIVISPQMGTIAEKSKQSFKVSFIPGSTHRQYKENIRIYFKGAFVMHLPLVINTLQPDILCQPNCLNFGAGLLEETLSTPLTIINNNNYACTLVINAPKTLQVASQLIVGPLQTQKLPINFITDQLGVHSRSLPSNFVQLRGYGPLKGPLQYRFEGKQTLLQFIPQKPFQDIVCSYVQQTKCFTMRNLSPDPIKLSMLLTAKQPENIIILSCEPTVAEIQSGARQQFRLRSIRADIQDPFHGTQIYSYNLKLMNGISRYCDIDFSVKINVPQLQVTPKVIFPLVGVGCWSRAQFPILNKGYQQVLLAIKKPSNIAFQLSYRFEGENRLTKLRNKIEVTVLFKSKKPVSFGVMLEVSDNFGRIYEVLLCGTATNTPILNSEKTTIGTSKTILSKQFSSSTSFKSLSNMVVTQDPQNIRFINKWLGGALYEFARDNETFHHWLRVPKNLGLFLSYLRCEGNYYGKDSLESCLLELNSTGYPMHTLRVEQLKEGNQQEWLLFIWLVVSKRVLHEDCLMWVNKLCRLNLQTYETAFNHRRKIMMDLLSKLLQPLFRGKSAQWQKYVQFLQPGLPFLTLIDNKRQFILTLNLIYHKFSKSQTHKLRKNSFSHKLDCSCPSNQSLFYWVHGTGNLTVVPGAGCLSVKQSQTRHTFSCRVQEHANISVDTREDMVFAFWNSGLYDAFQIYDMTFIKKPPNLQSVTIEALQRCSQEWTLQFVCQAEAQYFFQFSGDGQFKCQMPQIGVIKAGEMLMFRVMYSPNTLNQHHALLRISNKYQQHLYELKGKPFRSNQVDLEHHFKVREGHRHLQTVSFPQDKTERNKTYWVRQAIGTTEQLKSLQVKGNGCEIILQIGLQFTRLVHNKQILLEVGSDQSNGIRTIRLVVSVVARPVIVRAQLRGTIDQITTQKIPVVNKYPQKQHCLVSLLRITPQQYMVDSLLQEQSKERADQSKDKPQMDFKISPSGKMLMGPGQKLQLSLNYLPTSLQESYCQLRIKMSASESVFIYNFKGMPQVPRTDNALIILECQKDIQKHFSIKIPNKIKESVHFQVQTSLGCVSGPQKINIASRQTFIYKFTVLGLHEGQFQGVLMFKNQKFQLSYPLKILVGNTQKLRKVRVESVVRVSSQITIDLSNRADKVIEYQVQCDSPYLICPPSIKLAPLCQTALTLTYIPLFTGQKQAVLRLYNQSMQQIAYNIEMVAEAQKELVQLSCELAAPKKIKLQIRNTTALDAIFEQPSLPQQLSLVQPTFNLRVNPYQRTYLQLWYRPRKLLRQQTLDVTLHSRQIGSFDYTLHFTVSPQKIMSAQTVHYNYMQQSNQKQISFQMVNPFDQQLDFTVQQTQLRLSQETNLTFITNPTFKLKPFQTKNLVCRVDINAQPDSVRQIEEQKQSLVISCEEFQWKFPVRLVRVYQMKNPIIITCLTQELNRHRICLKKVRCVKEWLIDSLPQFKQNFNISLITTKQFHLETLFNKQFEYGGSIIFYDDLRPVAEKYELQVKVSGTKYQNISLSANVGGVGRSEIRLKKGKGSFKVELVNTKKKEFKAEPAEGQFDQNGEALVVLQYHPVEYNGNKKATVKVVTQNGCFNFNLQGKFPLKQKI